MLWATARAVREERSKQRHALQDFSQVRVSLVKGKQGWRVGSVEALGNVFMAARSRSDRAAIKHVITLLRRYIHGEQSLRCVYEDVQAALVQPEEMLQLVFTYRLLYTLGYISPEKELLAVVSARRLPEATAALTPALVPKLTKAITQAAATSQL